MPRPHQPLLNRVKVRKAALALIDRVGLDGLTMRKLAAELGVSAPSLYTHFPTKDELLATIAESIMAEVDVNDFAYEDWATAIRTWARSYRAALAAHPKLVPLLASGQDRGDTALNRADAVHGGLTRAGWPPRYATMIGASTKYLVLGAALGSFARGWADDEQAYLGRPHLSQAHLLREHAEEIDEESFELALTSYLHGLRALHAEVARTDPA